MELLDFLLVLIVVVLVFVASLRFISFYFSALRMKYDSEIRKERVLMEADVALKERAQDIQEQRRSAGQKGGSAPRGSRKMREPAGWVEDLLNDFGVDPMVIFEDEMPQELKMLVPLVKGFVQGGGLQKLLGGEHPGAPGSEEEGAI